MVVTLETSAGDIDVSVLADRAPLSAADFLRYVDLGLYNGAVFYRTVRADNDRGTPKIEVIQGGLLDEAKALPPIAHETTRDTGVTHLDGTVSLARGAPGTGSGAAFFICVGDQPALDFGAKRNPDGQGFAAFGRVVRGMDVVHAIHAMKADAPSPSEYMKGQLLSDPVAIRKAHRRVQPVASSLVAPVANTAASQGAAAGQGRPAPSDGAPQATPENLERVIGADVVVTAPRMEVPLKENPAATSVVTKETLATMPKTIAADEALKLVPGVRVENQAAGERVHLSIRGQGILTERGIRGIKVLLDGLPLNDPTGFAPDLFDVDWATVRRIEVFRGPASALFGGGAAGGILNIETERGAAVPHAGRAAVDIGSYGFWKALGEVGGSEGRIDYRASASRTSGDGYRVHTAYQATNLYAKISFASRASRVTAIVAGTSFFNENAEGLNLDQVNEDPQQPNPDALTYNEYQKTQRGTAGLTGTLALAPDHDLSFAAYFRATQWREAVPSTVQRRTYDSPGGYLQYTWHASSGAVRNHLSLGADMDWQRIDDSRRRNLGGAEEGAAVLADQDIDQQGLAFHVLDRIELSPSWSVMLGARHDAIDNTLTDQLQLGGVDLSGDASFSQTTGRAGVAWNPRPEFGAYASWGQGFMPPATEELANNPEHLGGFNTGLESATSHGGEIGARGSLAGSVTYDVALFKLLTTGDFGRYRVPERPLETFYRNAGDSRRWGVETQLGWFPSRTVELQLAYTWSDFTYDRVEFGTDIFSGTYLPNSPQHAAYLDASWLAGGGVTLGGSVELQTRSYIDPSNTTWIGGYTLFHLRLAWELAVAGRPASVRLALRNLTDKHYIAFTEPDPDGNSYQPAPGREVFAGFSLTL